MIWLTKEQQTRIIAFLLRTSIPRMLQKGYKVEQ